MVGVCFDGYGTRGTEWPTTNIACGNGTIFNSFILNSKTEEEAEEGGGKESRFACPFSLFDLETMSRGKVDVEETSY